MIDTGSSWLPILGAATAVMSAIAAIFAAFAAFFGPLKAAEAAEDARQSHEKRMRKLDCMRRFAAFRAPEPPDEWFQALNEIPITFNDSEAVILSFRSMNRKTATPAGISDSDILDLIKEMMTALDLRRENIDDSLLLTPFHGRKK